MFDFSFGLPLLIVAMLIIFAWFMFFSVVFGI